MIAERKANISSKRIHSRLARHGVASLELVLCFPFLIVLVAMLFTVHMATKYKTEVTSAVRSNAWLDRANPHRASNNSPFGLFAMHDSGQFDDSRSRTVNIFRNLFPGVPRTAKWENVVLAGSWDHRQVEFSREFIGYPHFGVLIKMVEAQGGVRGNNGQVSSLNRLFQIPTR
jgi:hypothetical protein